MAAVQPSPKHNKFSESVFRILHNLTTSHPNARALTNEALFTLNKTMDWLNLKSAEERNNMLQKVKTLTKSLKRFKERREVSLSQNS